MEKSPSSPTAASADSFAVKGNVNMASLASGRAEPSSLMPILLTCAVGCGAFMFGIHIGFSSPTAFGIEHTVGITDTEFAFIMSLLSLGAMGGSLASGPLSAALGPKRTLLFNNLVCLAGAASFYWWQSQVGLSFGRLLNGFAVGVCSVLVPLYIAEIAPASIRGALGCVNQLLIVAGIIFVNAIGYPLINDDHWWTAMVGLDALPAVIMLILLVFAPESPTWLMSKDNEEAARASLQRLRGAHFDVTAELDELKKARNSQSGVGDGAFSGAPSIKKTFFSRVMEPSALRPLAVGIMLVLIQQWSGVNAILFNAAELFGSDEKTLTRSMVGGAIAVNWVQFMFTGLAIALMSKAGRRFFLLLSTAGMAVSSVAMGFIYHFNAPDAAKIACVCFYLAFFALGTGPVVWLVLSEIMPSDLRGVGMGMATVFNWGSAFAVTVAFPTMNSTFSSSGTFWFYGGVLALGTVLCYFFQPETKDKKLSEIEEFFRSGKSMKPQSQATGAAYLPMPEPAPVAA